MILSVAAVGIKSGLFGFRVTQHQKLAKISVCVTEENCRGRCDHRLMAIATDLVGEPGYQLTLGALQPHTNSMGAATPL